MAPRQIAFAALLALIALGIFLMALWSPERQVRLHQKNLLKAVSKRDWERAASFMAEDYSDRWGHDKANVIELGREAFRHVLFLEITMRDERVAVLEDQGRVETRLDVKSSGSPVAQMIVDRADGFRQPFDFRWEHRSWKPWDWQLTGFDQPDLEMREWEFQ